MFICATDIFHTNLHARIWSSTRGMYVVPLAECEERAGAGAFPQRRCSDAAELRLPAESLGRAPLAHNAAAAAAAAAAATAGVSKHLGVWKEEFKALYGFLPSLFLYTRNC